MAVLCGLETAPAKSHAFIRGLQLRLVGRYCEEGDTCALHHRDSGLQERGLRLRSICPNKKQLPLTCSGRTKIKAELFGEAGLRWARQLRRQTVDESGRKLR